MQSQGLVTGTDFPKGADGRAQRKALWSLASCLLTSGLCGTPPPDISLSLEWPIISLQLKRQWSLLQQPECSQALGSESQHRSRGDWNGDFTVISPFTTPEGAVRITFVISRGVLSPFGKEFPLYLLHWTLGGNTDEKLWNLHQMPLNGAERRLSSYPLRVNSFLPSSWLLNCEMWHVLNSS